MKRILTLAVAVLLTLVLSTGASAQKNYPTIPNGITIKTGGGVGQGPKRSEVLCVVAVNDEDEIVAVIEVNEDNAEMIEMVSKEPELFITEVVIEVEKEN